jgi:hypothetical protein
VATALVIDGGERQTRYYGVVNNARAVALGAQR